MNHGRHDYNRIQDPKNKIPEKEPVLLLRAQDELACMAAAYYVQLCSARKGPQRVRSLASHVKSMNSWPTKKIPDLPGDIVEQSSQPQTP